MTPADPTPTPLASPVKERLLAVLAAQRALSKAAAELSDTWSADPATRNRPRRQELTTALMQALPRPMAFGDVVFAIAEECDVTL